MELADDQEPLEDLARSRVQVKYEEFDDRRIKHMEMVQAVIGRLGNDGFLVKGWAVTVVGVFLGLAVSSQQWELATASVLPTLFFWNLDSYFLRSERLFRVLHKQIQQRLETVEPFFMAATADTFTESLAVEDAKAASRWQSFMRPTLRDFYGGLIVSALLVGVAICVLDLQNP